jgi:hypothetical protein
MLSTFILLKQFLAWIFRLWDTSFGSRYRVSKTLTGQRYHQQMRPMTGIYIIPDQFTIHSSSSIISSAASIPI